jgi:hypothetical protein
VLKKIMDFSFPLAASACRSHLLHASYGEHAAVDVTHAVRFALSAARRQCDLRESKSKSQLRKTAYLK